MKSKLKLKIKPKTKSISKSTPKSKSLAIFFRKTHRLLALVIGLQMVIWCLSGLYMTSIHIDIIRGEHLVKPVDADWQVVHQNKQNLEDYSQRAFSQIKLTNDRPTLVLSSGEKIDLTSGQPLQKMDRQAIEVIAKSIYAGQNKIKTIQRLAQYPREIGGFSAPVWQVVFDDWLNSTLYLSDSDGQVIRKRSDLWRWFDFLWMLHIMDYESRDDVNNNIIRVAASLAVIFSLVGIGLLFFSFGYQKTNQSTRKRFSLKAIHRWIGVFVGIQLLLWTTSGLMFSILDKDKVFGKNLANWAQPAELPFTTNMLDVIISRYKNIQQIQVVSLDEKTWLRVNTASKNYLLDPLTYVPKVLDEQDITAIAMQAYKGSGQIQSVQWLTDESFQLRGVTLPKWKVDFNDENSLTLLISPEGKVELLITDTWRVFDFFWSLHTMNIVQRDFNHPLIVLFASLASFIAISGLLLLFSVFNLRDINPAIYFRTKTLKINNRKNAVTEINFRGSRRLLNLLRRVNIKLRADCGGGGSCGMCLIKVNAIDNPKISSDTAMTQAEKKILSSQQIKQGYRLACQYALDENLSIEVTNSDFAKLQKD